MKMMQKHLKEQPLPPMGTLSRDYSICPFIYLQLLCAQMVVYYRLLQQILMALPRADFLAIVVL